MKNVLAVLVSFGAMAFAQDMKQPPGPRLGDQASKRRLESVTWDLNSHKLVWVVQSGSEVDGKFVASSSDKYEISPDKAVMEYADEKRGFTDEEATSLHHLLDVLSLYCAESVIWWDQGQGSPVDPDARPASPRKQPESSEPKPRKVVKPAPKAEPHTQVASLGGAR
jgi:hypothetical protein